MLEAKGFVQQTVTPSPIQPAVQQFSRHQQLLQAERAEGMESLTCKKPPTAGAKVKSVQHVTNLIVLDKGKKGF